MTTAIDTSMSASLGTERLGTLDDPIGVLQEPLKRVAWDLLQGRSVNSERLCRLADATGDDLLALCHVASAMRDSGKGRIVTFSPKVFIPLTRPVPRFLWLLHLPTEPRGGRPPLHDA